MVDTHLTHKSKQTSLLDATKSLVDTLFYYTEGVKLLITPYEMRGKKAKYYYNAEGVELNAAQNITGKVLTHKSNQTSVLATTKSLADTLFYYTEGVKLLITPYEMWGKETKYYYNAKGVELNGTQNITGKVLIHKSNQTSLIDAQKYLADIHLTHKSKQTSLLDAAKSLVDTLFYYTEGVKLLITPYEMRGKKAKYYYNAKGVELNAAQNITGKVLTHKSNQTS